MPSLTSTSITKARISSPLEAGPSLLDAKQLPPQLAAALDYVSSRLARKRLRLSLIVVRKDVQIPTSAAAIFSQASLERSESQGHPIASSPAKSLFGGSVFTRTPSKSSLSSMSDSGSSTLGSTSTSTSTTSSSPSSLSRTNWPGLPTSPADRAAASPAPSTPAQPATPTTPNPYGITLMHASTLTPKAEKILRHTVAKAEKKFSIGSGWLSPIPLTTSQRTSALTTNLIHRSLSQNSVLFSSEGLTLLSLDHVYTFKCHLHTYSRTLTPTDLTLAVDELRRLVLAQSGKRITTADLMRAYDWLAVSLAALVDVNEGYKVAYGGQERFGGIDVQNEERRGPPPLKTDFAPPLVGARRMRLGLNVNFASASASEFGSSENDAKTLVSVDVGESAKGTDRGVEDWREDRGPHRRGPMTPNGFEDITPVTQGEWCFLMVGEGWKEAKTAPVETC